VSWKTNYRSFYYHHADEPQDIVLKRAETALLVVDIQNTYMVPAEDPADDPAERDRWQPFRERMNTIVIPNTAKLLQTCRTDDVEVLFARIACLKDDGRDRSLSQKKPGWNYLLMPKDTEGSQIVPELAPQNDEVVVCKTTDSALTGTNLRLILRNMDIKNVIVVGIFTDQCISSTVRSLADESFNVIVIDDCCAAGTDELHQRELEIINMIYCHVMSVDEVQTCLQD